MIPLLQQAIHASTRRPAQVRSVLEAIHRRIGGLLRLCNRLLGAVIILGLLFSLLVGATVGRIAPDSQITIARQSVSGIHDPDWDGLLTGAAWGMTLGQGIPLIGFILGPVAGAGLGYDLDRQF